MPWYIINFSHSSLYYLKKNFRKKPQEQKLMGCNCKSAHFSFTCIYNYHICPIYVYLLVTFPFLLSLFSAYFPWHFGSSSFSPDHVAAVPSLSGFPRLSSFGVLQAAAEVRQISCSEVFLFNSNKFVLVFSKQTTLGLGSFIYLNDSRLAFISKVMDVMF